MSISGTSDHTDRERSVASLDNRKHCIRLPCFSISSESILVDDAELASMVAGLTVGPEDASSFVDSAISIGRSSIITGTTAGVTQFSEVS